MKIQRTLKLMAAGFVLAPVLASAQMFKCPGPDGKIVFSDVRCEGPTAAAKVEKADPSGRHQLTDADKDRIKELEAAQKVPKVNDEQRTAASLEISSIRIGQEARLTQDQRKQRDALVAQLGSADAKKRKDALNALRTLYSE